MDLSNKEKFLTLWSKYFNNAELPICFYYSNDDNLKPAAPGSLSRCLIGALASVREGKTTVFDSNSIGCPGGKRYTGFSDTIRPEFEYFLSCGIPGKMEGERYKKNPELVKKAMQYSPVFKAPGSYLVFKRWDTLAAADNPEVVIFFATPDVLAGLFTLANFDEAEPNGVIAPFGSGCSTIVQHPYLEKDSERPRCIVGMFDISARPFVSENRLTFAAPMKKFASMIANMEESFLITNSWKVIQKRIG